MNAVVASCQRTEIGPGVRIQVPSSAAWAPQDIAVVLKILTIKALDLQYHDLTNALHVGVPKIFDSLNGSHTAELVDETKRTVRRQGFVEFIQYGLHYVFPQLPGIMVTGILTATPTLFTRSEPPYACRNQMGT